MVSLTLPAVCLVACHGGPAEHFATYAALLSKKGFPISLYAAEGPALSCFRERELPSESFSLGTPETEAAALSQLVTKITSKAAVVLTDVGHSFAAKLHRALAVESPHLSRFAYYDNPESFVPGGYSKIASEVMSCVQGILFANKNLATSPIYREEKLEVDLSGKMRIGLGYYPIDRTDEIARKRDQEREEARSRFSARYGLREQGQKIWVYFGGNNEVYFNRALPALLRYLAQCMETTSLNPVIFLVQQHPGAKKEDKDWKEILLWVNDNKHRMESPTFLRSQTPSDEAQIVADAAFYYQTSMGPQFILAGIPTVQVGHEPYCDILIREQLALSASTPDQFCDAAWKLLEGRAEKPKTQAVLEGLGFQTNWAEILMQSILGKKV